LGNKIILKYKKTSELSATGGGVGNLSSTGGSGMKK
jgi:hypothetical protein